MGEQLESRTYGDAERARIERVPRLLQEERDLERPPPRRRKRSEHLVEDIFKEIAEAGEREVSLRLGGAAREHAKPLLPGEFEARVPDRRLADPGLAFEDEGSRPVEVARADE